MAAIAFNTAQRAAERLEAVLTAVGEKFDVFVSYHMQQAAAEAQPARTPPDDEPAGTATPFRPLDAGILSEAIPAFFIGRNQDGFWIARDAKGRIGGLFLCKASAVSFARAQSRPAPTNNPLQDQMRQDYATGLIGAQRDLLQQNPSGLGREEQAIGRELNGYTPR